MTATSWSAFSTRTATLLAAAALTAGSAACSAPTRNEAQAPDPGVRHCVYNGHDVTALAQLEPVLGRVPDCAVVFHDGAKNWDEWADPWFLRNDDPTHAWASWVRDSGGKNRLILSQALVPEGLEGDWRARGAEGAYDQHAVALATALVKAGLGSSTIRLGAEANGTWNHDQAGNTTAERADWKALWARTVRAMRTVEGADFTFDWSINAGVRPIPFNEYYPGDDVVDVIGIDQYDSLPQGQATKDERWHRIRTQPAGLDALVTFADTRGKPISVPEAGLVEARAGGAGDNPNYVEGLRKVVESHDTDYVAYFDKNTNGTLRLEQVPQSAAAWRAWVLGEDS